MAAQESGSGCEWAGNPKVREGFLEEYGPNTPEG